jgi:hypothetical protein
MRSATTNTATRPCRSVCWRRSACAAITYPDRPRSLRCHGRTWTRSDTPQAATVAEAPPVDCARTSRSAGTVGVTPPTTPVLVSTSPARSRTTTMISSLVVPSTGTSAGSCGSSWSAGALPMLSAAAAVRSASSLSCVCGTVLLWSGGQR